MPNGKPGSASMQTLASLPGATAPKQKVNVNSGHKVEKATIKLEHATHRRRAEIDESSDDDVVVVNPAQVAEKKASEVARGTGPVAPLLQLASRLAPQASERNVLASEVTVGNLQRFTGEQLANMPLASLDLDKLDLLAAAAQNEVDEANNDAVQAINAEKSFQQDVEDDKKAHDNSWEQMKTEASERFNSDAGRVYMGIINKHATAAVAESDAYVRHLLSSSKCKALSDDIVKYQAKFKEAKSRLDAIETARTLAHHALERRQEKEAAAAAAAAAALAAGDAGLQGPMMVGPANGQSEQQQDDDTIKQQQLGDSAGVTGMKTDDDSLPQMSKKRKRSWAEYLSFRV